MTVSPSSANHATSAEAFLIVCGTQLCLQGKPFIIHGATAYSTYDNPSAEVRLAQAGKVNVLELVEFDTQYHTFSDTMSDATWTRVDKFIAAVKQAGLHVILNLSEYGQSLQAAGQTPTTVDWEPYLSFIANRTNTVTGVQYKNDPTIAMVEIFGEIDAPNYKIHPGTEGTTAEMTAFFHRTETEWHTLAPNILISTGGFSYLNDPNSGIDWRSIMSDAADPVCDIEINTPGDLATTVGEVTNHCKSLHKPWFLAAWSSCYRDTGYPYYLADDHAMAQHAQAMYDVAKGNSPATYAAIGTDFWNLQNAGTPAGTCSISPSFPLTWAKVQSNAP
jgi:aryl-phospho-beta-D-glucosidase BglC (GH1 family)